MTEAWTPGAIAALSEKEDLPFVRADAAGNIVEFNQRFALVYGWSCLLYTSPSPRDGLLSRMPSSA